MKKIHIWSIIAVSVMSFFCMTSVNAKEMDPGKIAEELWHTLQGEDYQKNWETWPGKGTFYRGREPHGALLTTYVNDVALDAIVNRKGLMPGGAVVCKENYTKDRTLVDITVMYKVESFNPKANDWFWVKYEPDGTVSTMKKYGMTLTFAGKIAGCIECHAKKSNNDFVFAGSLKE